MIPESFRLRPVKRTMKTWHVVRDLMRRRDFEYIVNACDAGREGELIFRYAYEHAGARLPVRRLWISSLTDEAIRHGFAQLRAGHHFDALAQAARARSQADWLVGLNATRAMTLVSAGSDLYSIGRVQTPTLALIVARDKEIKAFVPQPFWEVLADVGFEAKYTSARGATRLAKEEFAEAIVARVDDLTVQRVERRPVTESPPQLFDLTTLQRTANRRYGFSAERTLQIAQALYEKYKLITYPRTSSRYLSSDQRSQIGPLIALFETHPTFGPHAQRLKASPPTLNKRIIDDRKV
ncbi:MAG: DNA topoisomerase, partial [Planctomycetota bacterium]